MTTRHLEALNKLPVMDVTLIPIVETSLNYWQDKNRLSIFGIKQPMGIIVLSQSVKKVIKLTGEELPLEQFMGEHPEIKEQLDII